MSQHITRLIIPQAHEAHDVNTQRSFKGRLLSNSRWPPLREDYFQRNGVRVFSVDDTQLECGSLHNTESEKSSSHFFEANSVSKHWSGSSSESVSSSHSYLSSVPEKSSSGDDRFVRCRRSSNVDKILLDYHRGADKLSAHLARLGLQESGYRANACNGGTDRQSNHNHVPQSFSGQRNNTQQDNGRHKKKRRMDHNESEPEEGNSEIEGEQGETPPEKSTADAYYLACPYVKNDPDKYIRCHFKEIKSISILKQHLKREHKLCKTSCNHSKCQHIQSRRKGKDDKAVWYGIYNILFPDAIEPASPYIGDESRKHLLNLFEFLGCEHTKQLMASVNSRRRFTIAFESDFKIKSLELIRDVANSLYDQPEANDRAVTDVHSNHFQRSAPATRETLTFDNLGAVHDPGTYLNQLLLPQTLPHIIADTTPSVRHVMTSNGNTTFPILEDEDDTAGLFSQIIPPGARNIHGDYAQTQMNASVNPGVRHSFPNRRAEPWAIPESRPITNPEGMEQIDLQQILDEEALLNAQENQLFTGIGSDNSDWNHPQCTNARRQRTRVGPNNRWPTAYTYHNSTPYRPSQ